MRGFRFLVRNRVVFLLFSLKTFFERVHIVFNERCVYGPLPGYHVEKNEGKNETQEHWTDDARVAWRPVGPSSLQRRRVADRPQQHDFLSASLFQFVLFLFRATLGMGSFPPPQLIPLPKERKNQPPPFYVFSFSAHLTMYLPKKKNVQFWKKRKTVNSILRLWVWYFYQIVLGLKILRDGATFCTVSLLLDL